MGAVAYSEELADRMRELLGLRAGVEERRMFGALVFLVNGNIACGTRDDHVLVRLDREDAEQALTLPHVGPMDMSGKRMKAFIRVDTIAVESDDDLAHWVDAGANFAASLPPK